MLVVLVVFLFLQSLRATIIPILAVPVSIVGTFVGMHLLGFSINMLTMFGMILRHRPGGRRRDRRRRERRDQHDPARLGALDASLKADDRDRRCADLDRAGAGGGVLPVAFLGGVTGKLYQQFAVTIAISVVLSGLMALTLSPALAAIIIKAHHGAKKGFFRWFENGFAKLTGGYVGGVARAVQASPVTLGVFAAIAVGIFLLFRTLPGSFVPDEDQGCFFVILEAPDTASQGVVAEW